MLDLMIAAEPLSAKSKVEILWEGQTHIHIQMKPL